MDSTGKLRLSTRMPFPVIPCCCLQGDVRFAEVMGLMGAKVEWKPYSITITGGWYCCATVHDTAICSTYS